MSPGKRLALITFVVVALVALGWYLNRRRQQQAATPAAPQPPGPARTAQPDSAFARHADGSVDYSRRADGSFIPLT